MQYDIDYFAALYGLANRNIQQVSLRVAKLMLPVPAASKQVHDDLILGSDIGSLGRQILRVGFGEHHVHLAVDDVSGHHRIDRGNVKDG